jgi:hypothetical protein
MAQVMYNLITLIFNNFDVNDPRQRDYECHNTSVQGGSGNDTEYEGSEHLRAFDLDPSVKN